MTSVILSRSSAEKRTLDLGREDFCIPTVKRGRIHVDERDGFVEIECDMAR